MFDAPGPRRRRTGLWAALAAVLAIAVAVTFLVVGRDAEPDPAAGNPTASAAAAQVSAPQEGSTLGKAALENFAVTVKGAAAAGASITLDGAPVIGTTTSEGLSWTPTEIADGKHTVVVSGPQLPGGSLTRTFTVDGTAPKLTVEAPEPVKSPTDPVTIKGSTEPGLSVQADGVSATADANGAFALAFDKAPPAVTLQVADAAGNTATADATVVFSLPPTRAVHVTALAWTSSKLREPVLKMAREGRITAVQLDIKDEDGHVGYDSKVPLVRKTGAAKGYYDAKKAIDQLHKLNVRVIGRIVCFRDKTLAEWAWNNGHKDAVIQTRGGKPYLGHYARGDEKFAFTNFANKLVRDYNNDLAVEAAKLGFDDILFDYVRRPDGKISQLKVPGMSKRPAKDVAEFVRQTREALTAAGTHTYLGVSVYGIAATRPDEIAQDIPLLGKHVDYVAPMVYPSHWGPGEYGVNNPNKQPYAIVQRSLVDFQKQLNGTRAAVVPWLQDFSLGINYGPAEVKAQIKGAKADGIDDFIMWNAAVRYTTSALPRSDDNKQPAATDN